jgi:hypothetical protein
MRARSKFMAMAMVALQEAALTTDGDPADEALLPSGTRVEVKRRFDAKWSRGFEVVDHTTGAYRLRRLSDGATLPVSFEPDDVRPERRNNTWWI